MGGYSKDVDLNEYALLRKVLQSSILLISSDPYAYLKGLKSDDGLLRSHVLTVPKSFLY